MFRGLFGCLEGNGWILGIPCIFGMTRVFHNTIWEGSLVCRQRVYTYLPKFLNWYNRASEMFPYFRNLTSSVLHFVIARARPWVTEETYHSTMYVDLYPTIHCSRRTVYTTVANDETWRPRKHLHKSLRHSLAPAGRTPVNRKRNSKNSNPYRQPTQAKTHTCFSQHALVWKL